MTKRYLKTPEEVIDALQAGKVVTDGACRCKLYKGIIVCKDKEQWNITPTLSHEYGLSVDEPEPLKLEVGKFYKTRNGLKAIIYDTEAAINYPYCIALIKNKKSCTYYCTPDGKNSTDIEGLDLVAPWED